MKVKYKIKKGKGDPRVWAWLKKQSQDFQVASWLQGTQNKDPRGLESWPQARKGHDPDLGDLTPTTRKAQRCSPSSSIDKGVIRSHARDQEILRCFRRPHPYCYYIPFAYVLFQASLTWENHDQLLMHWIPYQAHCSTYSRCPMHVWSGVNRDPPSSGTPPPPQFSG